MATRPVIDLRSDTVTKPTPGMREAIASAEVGDDVLDHDPTVERLERAVAATLGKEAALFVPSGTMANQIAVRAHCPPGHEIILDRGSHVLNFESGAAAALSGAAFHPLDGLRGILDPDAVRHAVRPPFPHCPQTALVWAENTHNLAGGSVWPQATLDAVARVAHDAGLALHLDGARIWNASVAAGLSPARIVRDADSVSVCMSKGLGAPVGSLIVGSKEFIEGCWVHRKRMGGGMRQSGILAAAGLYALEHHRARLAEDHANARWLAERLATFPGVSVDLEATQSNIVIFDVAGTGRVPGEIAQLTAARDVLLVPFGATSLRAVTHLDVDRDDVARAVEVLAQVLGVSSRARPPVKRATPTGKSPTGRDAKAKVPPGKAATGRNARAKVPPGKAATGRNARAKVSTGRTATGRTPRGKRK
ncbi:MAG: GntG family PLP-dependent aldolase [bacterium]